MGEHDTAWLISRSSACEHYTAAHAWSLILDLLVDNSVFHILTHLHNLTPIVNFQILATVNYTTAFTSLTFCEDEACYNPEFCKLLLMLVKK